MIIHSNPLFTIYFGNAQDKLNQDEYLKITPESDLSTHPSFAHLGDILGIKSLLFLKQVHKNRGYVVTEETHAELAKPFYHEGDYLLTDLPGVGIGIMTADCLPIIIHDTRSNAIAAIHAGWRGSVESIAQRAFKRMQEAYGTRSIDVRVFFGPSAQPCCYEVGESVLAYRDIDLLLSDSLIAHNESMYLNIARYNMLQLMDLEVPRLAFHTSYNTCTICDTRLCSYRRDGKSPYRQMTVVALR